MRDGDRPIVAAWPAVLVTHAIWILIAARALEHMGAARWAAALIHRASVGAHVRVACGTLSQRRREDEHHQHEHHGRRSHRHLSAQHDTRRVSARREVKCGTARVRPRSNADIAMDAGPGSSGPPQVERAANAMNAPLG